MGHLASLSPELSCLENLKYSSLLGTNSLKNDYIFEPIYIENKPIRKKKRCSKGTRRNKKTGLCDSKVKLRTLTPYYTKSKVTKTRKMKTPDILKTIY